MIYKINKQIILESSILDKLKSFWAMINPIKLDKFIKNSKDLSSKDKKLIEESSSKKPKKENIGAASKRIKGETTMMDSCYTSIMKLIGREDLLKSTQSSGSIFLNEYEKITKPIKLTSSNAKQLKKGHIILFWYEPNPGKRNGFLFNNKFDENGLSNNGNWVESAAHFGIVIDPKKYLILHNSVYHYENNGDIGGIGSHLALQIQPKKDIFKGNRGFVLDMKVIDKMK